MSPVPRGAGREREGGREAKTNLHSWVCIRWMSEGGKGKEGAKERGSERTRRGEEWRRRGDEAATEKRREGNARIEATRPWQRQRQQLLYGVFMLSALPRSLARSHNKEAISQRKTGEGNSECGDPVGERRKRGPLKAGM